MRLSPGSLSVRLLLLLTVALLPLGLIAVYQTFSVISKVEVLSGRDMLAKTSETAAAQVGVIRQAHGAAYALGAAALATGPATPECDRLFDRFVKTDPRFAFAGFIWADGRMECSSNGKFVDMAQSGTWGAAIEDPRPRVTVNRQGRASGLSVMIASVPVYDPNGNLVGVSSISIPHSLSDLLFDRQIEGLEVAITDREGAILSASTGIEQSSSFEDLHIIPETLGIPGDGLSTAVSRSDGTVVNVSIVPLLAGEYFIIGKWTQDTTPIAVPFLGSATPLFPIVMWAAGLFVAFFALDRLVLRHLGELRRHMRAFSVNNLESSYVRLKDAPSEIAEIADSYNALLDRIMDDTVELAETVREKEMLLKEVHHRVKNNLQLIASILNMQLRHIQSPDAKHVLRRVQDRVMSLATIHKLLYAESQVEMVRADILLTEIVQSAINVGTENSAALDMQLSLDPVSLDPDQAVPLSLLVTEAVTNALKNIGGDGQGGRVLEVELTEPVPGEVKLRVANSCGPASSANVKDKSSGLGTRLIQAFVAQLEGTTGTERTEDRYSLWVHFSKPTPDEARAA